MNFEIILRMAKAGDDTAKERILQMYAPLLINRSMIHSLLDEDLYQELSITLLRCIEIFQI